jgi:acetyl-CoA carboxylase biotin carboxyl carrier protein
VAEIRAEMVANVWKVVATAGDHVDDGDTLVILESMKMEIPVLADAAGTVTKMHVAEGDVVQEGDLIAEIGLPRSKPSSPQQSSQQSSQHPSQGRILMH